MTNAKWSSLAEYKMEYLKAKEQRECELHLLKIKCLENKDQREHEEHLLRMENLKAAVGKNL